MSVEEVCRKYTTDIVQVSTLFQIKITLLHFLIFLSGVQVGVCCTAYEDFLKCKWMLYINRPYLLYYLYFLSCFSPPLYFSSTHIASFHRFLSIAFIISRVWPMPGLQSIWPGMAPTLWLHPLPPQNGSSSVVSCSVASPSCCGLVPSSASWPMPSRLPQRMNLLGIM